MKEIAIIIPIHELNGDNEKEMLLSAIDNVKKCQKNTKIKLNTYIVTPLSLDKTITKGCKVIKNEGSTDFASQVNLAVNTVSEEYFSILEFDDQYNVKWFSMVEEYYKTNEDVSVFLPINIASSNAGGYRMFINEQVWAIGYSSELGFIDHKCLSNMDFFNLTGGVFKKSDFESVGMFSIENQPALTYDFLFKATKKGLRVYVVPKEGYKHILDREGSFTDVISKEYTQEEIETMIKSVFSSKNN